MTTIAKWLASREPAPPEALVERVVEALGDGAHSPAHEAARRTLHAAEDVLATLLRDGCETRSAALELLTADALVTYAFEAAAEQRIPDMDELAAVAMRRIAVLGAEGT